MAQPHLVLVLGDQLTESLSALRFADKERDIVVMAELAEEAEIVPHHVKKLVFLFSSMRKFAASLAANGWRVAYGRLDAEDTAPSLIGELVRRREEFGARRVIATECGDWRLRTALESSALDVELLPDDRFLISRESFAKWASGRKVLRMDHFYREMRRRTGLLTSNDRPVGGKWSFDTENRKPPRVGSKFPKPMRHQPDSVTEAVLAMIEARYPKRFGKLRPFWFATTTRGAQLSSAKFMREALPLFGDYQDAMLLGEKFLYHSLLSLYLNVGFLRPLDLCRAAEKEYLEGRAPLNSVEGFIRQIIGWREYIRGVWDLAGPGYVSRNALAARRDLPWFYWSGETDMACMRAVIGQTIDEAYAHHIQRLMVTGNFAMLAGVDPARVHEWYLAVYADAHEWVEAPNVLGMSQYADGGLLASKPYAASGAYLNRMSDYCRRCGYDVRSRESEKACPFNSLYWHFIARNADRLAANPRMAPIYRSWKRMEAAKQEQILKRANMLLARLDAKEAI